MCDYTMYFSSIYLMCVGFTLFSSMTINLYFFEPTEYKSEV